MARLKILSEDSLNSLYEIPKLNEEDRQNIFALDEADQSYLEQLNSIPVKVNYILHLGYFRIAQYFFTFTFQKVREDVWFILKTYFPGNKFPKKQIGSRQYYTNRQFILQKHGMALYSKSFEGKLSKYLEFVVKQHAVPRYLFDSALDYCHQHKVMRLSYSILQILISDSLQIEKKG